MVWGMRSWGQAPDPKWAWAATFYGDKGTLKLSVDGYEFTHLNGGEVLRGSPLFEYDKYPEDRTEKDLERHVASAVREHMRDFLRARKDRSKPVADIEQGHISTASCILGNHAMALGRSLRFDPEKGHVVGDDAANKLLRRTYRAPWVHPDPKSV
jgi:hypothetical protein